MESSNTNPTSVGSMKPSWINPGQGPVLAIVCLLARQAAAEQIAASKAHKAPSSPQSTEDETGHDKTQD
jgi:hypothetical protein